jgi:hypothetical protein
MSLSEPELAYMRETQAEARPTEAGLRRRVQGTTASGGRADTYADPATVGVRLDGNEDNVPPQVLAAVGGAKPVKITMDLVEVRSGDTLTISASEVYQIVTDPDPDEWATAQVVWAKRTVWPKRTA